MEHKEEVRVMKKATVKERIGKKMVKRWVDPTCTPMFVK
jgi:hypothetical protein